MTATYAGVEVALPLHLLRNFYYLPALAPGLPPQPGVRVSVPFGKRQLVGVVVGLLAQLPEAGHSYKPLLAVLDASPLTAPDWLAFTAWAARYYQQPYGEVLAAALPPGLRAGEPLKPLHPSGLALTAEGHAALATLPPRAQRLRSLLQAAALHPVPRAEYPAELLRRALQPGWLVPAHLPPPAHHARPLSPAQASALAQLHLAPAGFGVSLLEGATGSGKTELYLALAAQALAAGQQVLLLVPEIGLTPQLSQRCSERFGTAVLGYHSGLGDAQRLASWLAVREARPLLVVGTRSALWLPFANLQLVLIDEEHDASFKQQDGFRYHARDLAVLRAKALAAKVLLGSATPSLETLANVQAGRYRHVVLPAREGAAPVQPQLIDLKRFPARNGLSAPLAAAVQHHVAGGGQALLFINRRGYAPTLFCQDCHWVAPCPHCDARLATSPARQQLACHHCGYLAPAPRSCPSCGSAQLLPLGAGTERVEAALHSLLPGARIERFDSDRFSSASAVKTLLDEVRAGQVQVLVGTQMLAKGHDFESLSLVGVIDADPALYATDFRATERLCQLLTQVAGRAGRSTAPKVRPEVFIQTREPGHPLLQSLLSRGYATVAKQLLAERQLAGLPPYAHMALLRAEAPELAMAEVFLTAAKTALGQPPGVQVLGPAPATMPRRARHYRMQLLLLAPRRSDLQAALAPWALALERLKAPRSLRFSLDVDPADLA